MRIGVPMEIQPNENRISVTPQGVETLIAHGHTVLVERGAGVQSGFEDQQFERAGANIVNEHKAVFHDTDMVLKVREPDKTEIELCVPGQMLFSFFNFLTNEEMTLQFLESEAIAIAYETVESEDKTLPLLLPMSEIAGRLSVQHGAWFLEQGRGLLLGGTPGVPPGTVLILGGGVVGSNAARIAAGMGAHVYIADTDINRLRYLDHSLPGNVSTIMSNGPGIRERLPEVDLLIAAARRAGEKAPTLITKDMLSLFKKGSVIVDVSVDEGGCVETTVPTTHENPTYEIDGVVHYGVTNMPSSVPFTSTIALTNVTLPYALELADKGFERAFAESRAIQSGVNIYMGKVTRESIANRFDLEYTPVTRI